jgi:hypothetical protein
MLLRNGGNSYIFGMPGWLREALDYIVKEGRVIKDAPVAFGVFVLLAALVLWAGLSWKFDAQIASRDSIIASRDATIRFQDGLLGEYKTRVQLPEAGEDRKLTPEQKRVLTHEIHINASKLSPLVIFAISERESKKYAKEFVEIIRNQDIPVITRELSTEIVGDVGLFVLVQDLEHPADEAKLFMEILTKANLNAHYMQRTVPPLPEEQGSKFALYIAHSPWV